MAKLYGAQRLILHTLLEAQGDTQTFIKDTELSRRTMITLSDIRNWLLTLDREGLVDLAVSDSGMLASATAKGRLTLWESSPFMKSPPTSRQQDDNAPPLRSSWEDNGALLVAVSHFSSPLASALPILSIEMRHIERLLLSGNSNFLHDKVRILLDEDATHERILASMDRLFREEAHNGFSLLCLAGYSSVRNNELFYYTYDSVVHLSKLLHVLNQSKSEHVLAFLDFVNRPSELTHQERTLFSDREMLARSLNQATSPGKLIIASISDPQALESSQTSDKCSLTQLLRQGLMGEAVRGNEVTLVSLFDFVDSRRSELRSMLFGQMSRRITLMNF